MTPPGWPSTDWPTGPVVTAQPTEGGEAQLPSESPAPLAEDADLAFPAVGEPARWRQRWWEAERAGAEPSDLADGITQELWAVWGAVLTGAGVDRRWLAAVVGAYRRELWLWLLGERTWVQASSGLTGRVTRRLPLHELRHPVRCP